MISSRYSNTRMKKLTKKGMESLTGNRILDLVIGALVIIAIIVLITAKWNALWSSMFGG